MDLFFNKDRGISIFVGGPMKSGKSDDLVHRVKKYEYSQGSFNYQLFRPNIPLRSFEDECHVGPREGIKLPAITVDKNIPSDIINHYLEPNTKLVGIDEAPFFDGSLVGVVKDLMRRKIDVITVGLDTSFRGEALETASQLMAIADDVVKLYACCEYPSCGKPARWTQRLINGEPAPYDDPLWIVGDGEGDTEGNIEGKIRTYQARCLEHHIVPR
jgi:thymidine kinase